ncbi:hypothetical protein AKG98_276 [Moritella sp. JT01]|uniref:hypothetical protein n=1 Tax=Moritella sp. JT01 TaxID=756698 RepID=UPI00079AF2D3|nr:hypothetical protein [Moritella sp. JT01]KXO14200.1 hypothetical protein AKG98_276 [Moritella sp. JT01]
MRYFTLLFVMVMGFNAQADTYTELAIPSTPLLAPASLLVNANEAGTAYQDVGESEQPPVSSPTHAYEFALTETSRYTSAGRLRLNNPEPDYQIEIELSIPPSASLVIGYAVNINFEQYWLTGTSFSKSRISGWKDSNLLYSHRQYPAVITSV